MPGLPPFSAQQCDALFAAVLVNDRVDPAVDVLPDIDDCTQAQLIAYFGICRQLWATGVDRRALDRTMRQLHAARTLDADGQTAFKHVRAKFKQLRFAFANADARHRYPRLLDFVTAVMGHLQDDFKNGRSAAVGRRALLLRPFLMPAPYALIGRELDRFVPSTEAAFRTFVAREIGVVRAALARDGVTGTEFHAIRKIVSRQASLYAGLATLEPSERHAQVFAYLSVINGLMGRLHDDLVVRRLRGEQDYHGHDFALPEDIRHRLHVLTTRYPR